MTDRPGVLDLPAAFALSGGYDRHDPTPEALRSELAALAARRPWADLDWAGLIEELLAAGRTDVPLSRLLEGHIDALRILRQAGAEPAPNALYGVWASRSQRTGVAAEPVGDDLVLSGTVRFASGAGVLDRALLPVWLDGPDGQSEHVLIDLPVRELSVDTHDWQTAAMAVSRSFTVRVSGLRMGPEARVGEPGFYLGRPGFFPGGVGVAACWAGGAARLLDLSAGRLHGEVPESLVRRLGLASARLGTALALVRAGAGDLDRLLPRDGPATPETDWHRLATSVRAGVAEAVHAIIEQTVRIAGPAGLAYDVDLTRAVHDLQLYVLQDNLDADHLLLGRRLLG